MIQRALRIRPRRLAAVAPQMTDEQHAERQARGGLRPEVEELCLRWGWWTAQHRKAGPPQPGSPLGRLRTPARTGPAGGPFVPLDADCAAFNAALRAQEERAWRVVYGLFALPFEQGRRVPVKVLERELGLSRATIYRVRNEAATRAFTTRHQVLAAAQNLGRDTGGGD